MWHHAVDLSLRGSAAGGIAVLRDAAGALDACPRPDEGTSLVSSDDDTPPSKRPPGVATTRRLPYLAPRLAVRARWGYLFGEAGVTWKIGASEVPAAYALVGLAPFG